MARAHGKRIGSSEDNEKEAYLTQMYDESQVTGWAEMLPEKDAQAHVASEMIAYATEQRIKDLTKRRSVYKEVRTMSQGDQSIKKVLSCDKILPMLPSLMLIEDGDYYKYMITICEKVGRLTNFPNLVRTYLSEAATLHPEDCDNVPPHARIRQSHRNTITRRKWTPAVNQIEGLAHVEGHKLHLWKTKRGGNNTIDTTKRFHDGKE